MSDMRYIVLEVHTHQLCRDADDYQAACNSIWPDLALTLSNKDAKFYKRVGVVEVIEGEAKYASCGVCFEVLVGLEPAEGMRIPDIAKPELHKVLDREYGWLVASKRVVPNSTEALEAVNQVRGDMEGAEINFLS